MTLEFDPVLLTGVDDIDAQHRELFDRIRALLEASRHRRSREDFCQSFHRRSRGDVS